MKSLLSHCQALQQQRARGRSQWELNLLGQFFSFPKLLDDLVKTLHKGLRLVKGAAELATSVDSVHAVAPYLLIRGLPAVRVPTFCEVKLRHTGDNGEFSPRRSLYLGLNKALPVIFRCLAYESVISHARTRRPAEHLNESQAALTDLCACVLQFLCAAQGVSSSNLPGRIWCALWDPSAIIDFEKALLCLEQALQTEAVSNRVVSLMRISDTVTNEISAQLVGLNQTV